MPWPIPEQISINAELYDLLEVRPGQRKWDTTEVPSQPGDGGKLTVYPLEFHGGFGASRRFLDGQGRLSDPSHHAYSQNFNAHVKGAGAAAPRITYISFALGAARSTGFRFGGTKAGQLGGGSGYTSLGGGSFSGQIASIVQYGNYLYCSGGINTYAIDPGAATPALVETRQHGNANARIFSSDVFDSRLVVALGADIDAQGATTPYSSPASGWTTFTGVKMAVFKTGAGGRLFSAKANRVYNVLPGVSPESSANYLPTAGEPVVDTADEVRGLSEHARGLVAGTKETLRTFDPDAGFQGRSLLPAVRASASNYDGRAIINVGEWTFFATPRAVWLLMPGREPHKVGPELLDNNETAYKGGQPGVPTFDGEALYWPYYYATSGDSVIWRVTPRREGEQGTGAFVWDEFLYLAGRECRCAGYWGGDATYRPRLFFGAGTPATPQQVGWVQLGRGGSPDLFDANSVPALSGSIYSAIDDFGKPGVVKEVDRLEFPSFLNTDANNYLVASVSDDEGSTFKDLVKTNTGAANDQRITGTGFRVVFADVNTPSIPAGRWLQMRLVITQASGATTHAQYRGTPQLYVLERPSTAEQVTTLLKVAGRSGADGDTETVLDRLKALVAGAKVQVKHLPGDDGPYVKVTDVRSVEVETFDAQGDRAAREVAVQLTYRVVPTA